MKDNYQISVQEVDKRLQTHPQPKLLDVREPAEYEIVHLPGALLATQEAVDDILQNWSRDTEIVCYCHHGIRSLSAAAFLSQQGFNKVSSMAGGIDAWAVKIDPSLARY